MNNTIKLERIDQQLEAMDSQNLLMIANILGQANLGVIELGEIAQLLGEIAERPKSLQKTILDSIFAKIKAK